MTSARRNNLIRHTYVLVVVAILVTAVWALHKMAGLPFIIAMLAGGPILFAVTKVIVHPFFPPPPPLSDEERAQMPRIRPMWVVLGIAAAALFSFGTRMPFPISLPLVVVLIGPLVALELRERRQAEHRLRVEQESAASCRASV